MGCTPLDDQGRQAVLRSRCRRRRGPGPPRQHSARRRRRWTVAMVARRDQLHGAQGGLGHVLKETCPPLGGVYWDVDSLPSKSGHPPSSSAPSPSRLCLSPRSRPFNHDLCRSPSLAPRGRGRMPSRVAVILVPPCAARRRLDIFGICIGWQNSLSAASATSGEA